MGEVISLAEVRARQPHRRRPQRDTVSLYNPFLTYMWLTQMSLELQTAYWRAILRAIEGERRSASRALPDL